MEPQTDLYYIHASGQQSGPFPFATIRKIWPPEAFPCDALIWNDAWGEWRELEHVLHLDTVNELRRKIEADTLTQKRSTEASRIRSSIVMTRQRATQIVDRLAEAMDEKKYVGPWSFFVRFSAVGVQHGVEVFFALYIEAASMFQQAPPSKRRDPDTLECIYGGYNFVTGFIKFLPDRELDRFGKITKESIDLSGRNGPPIGDRAAAWNEYQVERDRLKALAAAADPFDIIEEYAHFYEYLLTLNPEAPDFWNRIYQRLGLMYQP